MVHREGLEDAVGVVVCPVTGRTTPLERCEACARRVELRESPEGPVLRCRAAPGEAAAARAEGLSSIDARLEETKVRDVMMRDVVCVDDDLTLDELAQVFQRTGVRIAPVVDDDGLLLGMVSTNDLVRGGDRLEGDRDRATAFPPACLGVLVEDVMTPQVVSLFESATLAEALRVFAARGLHRIPVVTAAQQVVGILSVTDLLRWMAAVKGP
jgi:CBS-domain-containing membrane protein